MPKAKQSPGFSCPDCGMKLHVVCVRQRARGIIVRLRECPCCGRMQQTVERPHGEMTAPVQK